MDRPGAWDDDPLWYKDAVFYELRVRSFHDSNADGIGDFRGLTEKLDYLEDLGVTALWLLPFYPSPLRDDGYDISDYCSVHPECGTLADFKLLLREAQRRGLRVVTELVLNHTSDRHPWFQRARRAAPGSRPRSYYVWSDTVDRYRQARVIFKDFEPSNWTWDPVARAYYWHRFYAHQPDLNFDSPDVRRETVKVVDFWLGLGVDGLRLDAVPYLFERRGTSCENLPETHAFLRELRRHIDRRFRRRLLLAEANQWPEDAAAYLAEGKECHMAFHFPLMPRLFLALRMEDRFPLTDIWAQTPPLHHTCQWALFLRNHDELTLEMVTDEERDYLYRAYAQEPRTRINLGIRRRLAPLLGNNRRAIELLNGLLLSLPGTPVVYYGDEIGMGDNVYLGDRNGVRTPMQWSADRNAGFSRADAQQLFLPPIVDHEYHYEALNVEAQQRSRHSLLWWMKRIIALRKRHRAFGRGDIAWLDPDNPKVLAFVRRLDDERILVVANLSRFVQLVRLDLSAYGGLVPVELFGRSPFPRIGERPYFLTLGPHGFYWFALEPPRGGAVLAAGSGRELPAVQLRGSALGEAFGEDRDLLEQALSSHLGGRRWFAGKAQALQKLAIVEAVALPAGPRDAYLVVAAVEYAQGEPESYLLPLAIATADAAREVRSRWPRAAIAELHPAAGGSATRGLLYDGLVDPAYCQTLLGLFEHRGHLQGLHGGELRGVATAAYRRLGREAPRTLAPRLLTAEQSNSSVAYADRFMLKVLRRLDEGVSPELEMGRFLTARASFPHVPPLHGWLEYRSRCAEPTTLAVLQGFVPNRGDAWRFTREELRRFFERALARRERPPENAARSLAALLDEQPPDWARRMIGAYLGAARLLGRRTAELHLALAAETEDPAFLPEPYSALHGRSLYQSMRNLAGQTLRLLRRQLARLPEGQRRPARALLRQEAEITRRFDAFLHQPIAVPRIRCHGDLHLGQVLHTGKDFVIIDFEGEPARALADRRRKRSCLVDVAGMLRSFHYAARSGLREAVERGLVTRRTHEAAARWADLWQIWVSWAFLQGHLDLTRATPLVPGQRAELRVLLDTLLLEKAVYELYYELGRRPDWIEIPLHGCLQLLGR
ncbi:MAG: maltose alpha-D-glucosyltransferase [Deltaproteobacteria bacterium]|nr:maltose alpha-D-glucosyltransferase [Deltaproteobacteria bacterium]